MRSLRVLAALAALALVAAACGDDDDTGAEVSGALAEADDAAETDDGAADEADDDAEADEADEEMDDEADEEMDDEEMMDATTFRVVLENTSGDFALAASGAQPIPVGGTEPGPALPGDAYELTVPRSAGFVSFATMFVQSNDWFWAPDPQGIPLVDADGTPTEGDVTSLVSLWDAGTEADQTPGEGADQAPRQAGPNTGDADPDTTLRAVDGFDATNYIAVTFTPNDDGSTLIRIENVSADASVPGPIAPVAWAVHGEGVTFFEPGAEAPAGFEMLAEDGGPGDLVDALAPLTGTATPFAPVAWAAAEGDDVLFGMGGVATAGLEVLAEDGGPADLVAELEADPNVPHFGAATNPDGGSEAGPALPGSSYDFEIVAAPGERFWLASMFVQSNDWFVTLPGIELFDADGNPLGGDVTDQLGLYDAGTEVDQAIGAGPDQAPRQAGPNTGATDEDTTIRVIEVANLADHLTVTIEPVG